MVISTQIDIRQRLTTYERARRRGVEFLLAQIDSTGHVATPVPRVTYYRVPWALAVSGETDAAYRVLTWIERHGIAADGAFHGGVPWDQAANRAGNTYPETCLAYGAQLLRQFDLARRAMTFARRFQDAGSGGIFMHRDQTGSDSPQLLFLTCQFGMSAVMTGDLDAALAVGAWLDRLWQAQPALPERLHTVWTTAGGLVDRAPEGERVKHYVQYSQRERELHYNGGIAAAALTHLAMATGDERWLDLARAYQRFSMESTDRQFLTKQVCKSAWGSGLLFLITGDDSYVPWLTKMGDWFAGGQDADGGWSNTAYLDPEPPIQHRVEITAEFVVHLDTLIAALANAAARSA